MITFRMSSSSSSSSSSRRSTMMILVRHSIITAIIHIIVIILISSLSLGSNNNKLVIRGVDSFTAQHHQPSTTATTKGRSYNQRYYNKLLSSCRHHHQKKKNRFLLTRHYSSSMDNNNTEKNLEQLQSVGERYICLFDNYNKVKGSYFNALFDQMFDQTRFEYKHVAFLITNADIQNIIKERNDHDNNGNVDDNDDDDDEEADVDHDETTTTTTMSTASKIMDPILNDLKVTLDLNEIPELFIMDDWNPLKIQERFSSSVSSQQPSIIWVYGNYNALNTRHLLRTSGFDKYIQKQCASSSSSSSSTTSSTESSYHYTSMFIGEGTGALCASYTMDIANTALSSKEKGGNNNDPKNVVVVPELQKFGLQLICGDGSSDSDDNNFDIDIQNLKDDQVFVWSQQQQQDESDDSSSTATATATKFIITPSKRGTIEKYETPNQLPPLIITNNKEGVQCNGEPSIDPSRSIQLQDIGESEEWW
jgi:hypothetical protein